jgi:alpha-mannosidase
MIVHMIGNAHIDPVWMWPWQAGADEALATCRAAADRCDEYPEFIFTRGEAWVYQIVERIDPELFARIRRLIERGQWHVTGGQFIQPDSNLPTAEGWRRQFRHGRQYFRDRFGVEPTVAFNVDSFGHPATLPDILASEGYEAYVFHRPHESQVSLPAAAFRWRGSGGAEVLGFRIAPVYVTRTDDLWGQITVALETADPALGHTMCFYGVGNHGGGPTKGNIEYILANRHSFDGHELRFSTPAAFFTAIANQRDRLPVVETELQHTFPGCYSVMHDVKQRQRRGELLLARAARAVERFADDEDQRRALTERVDWAWDDLLFTAFHDVLSGTSIPSAWESVRAMQGRAWIVGEEAVYDATRRWARRTLPPAKFQQIALVNPDREDWEGLAEFEPWLEFDLWRERWLATPGGQPVDFQLVQPEAQQGVSRVLFPARVPASGALQLHLRDDAAPERTIASDLRVSPAELANDLVRIELDGSGVRSLVVGERNVLGEGGIGLHLRDDHTDTWTFTTDRFEEPVAVAFASEGWAVEERGPLRVRVRTEGWLGHSWVRWTLSLHRGDPRVWMLLEVNFAERYKALQLPIRLAETPGRWTDGLAGGQVERRPNPAEWPVLGWSRVEVAGTSLALATHDAYSLSLNDGVWQWTLLRSPRMSWGGRNPEMYVGRDWHTDQGPHVFSFVLMPGAPLDAAALATAARQLAQPPVAFDRYEGLGRPPWGAQAPRRLWTGAEQRAEAAGRLPLPVDERGSDPFL